MEFSKFELTMLEMLTYVKFLDLKCELLNLSVSQNLWDIEEYKKESSRIIIAKEATEKLHDKILKYLEV